MRSFRRNAVFHTGLTSCAGCCLNASIRRQPRRDCLQINAVHVQVGFRHHKRWLARSRTCCTVLRPKMAVRHAATSASHSIVTYHIFVIVENSPVKENGSFTACGSWQVQGSTIRLRTNLTKQQGALVAATEPGAHMPHQPTGSHGGLAAP
jgi:hypothetical protein